VERAVKRLAVPAVAVEDHIASRVQGAPPSSIPTITRLTGSITRAVRASRRDTGRRLVKSVHCGLALPWIAAEFRPRFVLVERDPLDVAASYLRLHLPDADRNIFGMKRFVARELSAKERTEVGKRRGRLERIGHQIFAMRRAMRRFAQSNAGVVVVSHRRLVEDPVERFRDLFATLDIPFTSAARRVLVERNRPGTGFVPARVAADEIEKWRRQLDGKQVATLRRCAETFGQQLSTDPPKSPSLPSV
jgi:hypothetical protein